MFLNSKSNANEQVYYKIVYIDHFQRNPNIDRSRSQPQIKNLYFSKLTPIEG
jgi:hypothetical protein